MLYTGNPIPLTFSGEFATDATMRSLHVEASASGRTEFFDVPLFGGENSFQADVSGTCLSLFGAQQYIASEILSKPRIITPTFKVTSFFTDKNGNRQECAGNVGGTVGEVALGRKPDYIPTTLVKSDRFNSLMPEFDIIVVGGQFMYAGGHQLSVSPEGVSRAYTIPELQAREYKRFHIINTFGVSDIVFAKNIETAGFEFNRKSYSRVLSVSDNRTIGDRFISTKPVRRTYQMSSGACHAKWAEWWLFEFCNAEHVWMDEDGTWQPVEITIKNSTSYSGSEGKPCHVDFTVTLLTT